MNPAAMCALFLILAAAALVPVAVEVRHEVKRSLWWGDRCARRQCPACHGLPVILIDHPKPAVLGPGRLRLGELCERHWEASQRIARLEQAVGFWS